MIIMGLAGEMGSGKDTAANYLVEHHGFTKLAFADNLKEMCKNAFDLTDEDVYGEVGKFRKFETPIELGYEHIRRILLWAGEDCNEGFKITNGVRNSTLLFLGTKFETPRNILQFVGTEICRDLVNKDYHALVVKFKIDKLGLKKVAISDSRFPNERNAIKKWGGTNVLIKGRTTEQAASDSHKSHKSENSLGADSEYDTVIINDGTLEDLYKDVFLAIKGY
jgi:hypothetical protein